MSSSLHVPRRLPDLFLVAVLLAIAASTTAQQPGQPAKPAATEAVIALGQTLFNDTRLSSTGTMSCATCHRPERSFTDARPHAVGQSGTALGRNTPTLLGLASVSEFPVGGSSSSSPRMVSLEERVVVPLREVAEMSNTVGEAIDRLAKDTLCVDIFNSVFEEPGSDREPQGVTGDRIAAALAGYVRSLQYEGGPSRSALAGGNVALDAPVSRGLEVFRGEGRCQSCHSGPGLTDGQLHVVSRPRARRRHPVAIESDTTPGSRPVAVASVPTAETRPEMIRERIHRRPPPRRGTYGGTEEPFERQTLTLLDLKRTAPYFRDGSAPTLSDAVRQHVADLRDIGAIRVTILDDPGAFALERRARTRMGEGTSPLSPSSKTQLSSDGWIPANLARQQVDDLVSFLNSL